MLCGSSEQRINTTMESHCESRKRIYGLDPGSHGMSSSSSSRLSSPWTLAMVTIVLFFVSSAQCLPVDLAQPPESSKLQTTLEGEEGRQQRQQPNNYQLVHQGQLYLPSLFQNGRADASGLSSTGSDYPVGSPSQDDSIGTTEWETVIDPHLYVLNEWSPSRSRIQQRKRRSAGPSLSIVNPLDVLRQRLLLEIARRRMIKSQNQILVNAEILKNIGRRR